MDEQDKKDIRLGRTEELERQAHTDLLQYDLAGLSDTIADAVSFVYFLQMVQSRGSTLQNTNFPVATLNLWIHFFPFEGLDVAAVSGIGLLEGTNLVSSKSSEV